MDDEDKLRLRDVSLWADMFITAHIAIPFNLQTAELLLSAFIVELVAKGLVTDDEYLGMMAATIFIKKLVERA